MTTEAISSFGIQLKLGDGATPTESFTTIAEVKDTKPPALKQATEEVTNHGSTGGWREFVGTLLEGGEVTFTLNFVPTDATQGYSTGLIADLVNKTLRNFQLIFPDAGSTTWAFAAHVTGFEPDAKVEGALEADVTLEISGQPTLA